MGCSFATVTLYVDVCTPYDGFCTKLTRPSSSHVFHFRSGWGVWDQHYYSFSLSTRGGHSNMHRVHTQAIRVATRDCGHVYGGCRHISLYTHALLKSWWIFATVTGLHNYYYTIGSRGNRTPGSRVATGCGLDGSAS